MSCIALDSTNPAAVIAAVKLHMMWRNMKVRAAFGYNDGVGKWPQAEFDKLKAMGVAVATISAIPGGSAQIYDVEKFDWTPAKAAPKMGDDARAGHWPVAYVNRSNKASLIADLASEGLTPGGRSPRGFGLWVATLDGGFTDTDGSDLRSQPGVVAVQYAQADSPIHAGGPADLDVSVVTAAGELWLGLASPLTTALNDLEGAIGELQAVATILRSQGA
jgi:hypothetical protein